MLKKKSNRQSKSASRPKLRRLELLHGESSIPSQLEIELKESEQRFKSLFANAPDAILLVHGETGLVYEANNKANLLFEASTDELKQYGVKSYYAPVQPQGSINESFAENSRRALLGQEQLFERHILTRNGNLKICEVRTIGFPMKENQMIIRASYLDITERRKVELQNKALQEELIQSSKSAALGVLVAGIAHEINNPLAIIWGNVERMRKLVQNIPASPKALSILRSQEQAVKRASLIVSGMLEFANPAARSLENVDVHQLITSSITQYKGPMATIGLELVMDLQATDFCIKANAEKMRQALQILISNAQDACLDAKRKGVIGLQTRNEAGALVLTVTDNGAGIPPGNLSQIFDPFFTTKPPGRGTGLGLTLARTYVDCCGGTLAADSVLGEGAQFTLNFPILNPNLK